MRRTARPSRLSRPGSQSPVSSQASRSFGASSKGGAIGGRLHPQSVSKIVKARIAAHHERSGVSAFKAQEDAARYSGHSLRVGFAVSAAERGADIRSIASVTRHRSLAMPARYAEKADQVRTSSHRLPGVGLKQATEA